MLPSHYPVFKIFSSRRVHLGLTGSVAAFKTVSLARELQKTGISLGATLTRSAVRFMGPLTLTALDLHPVYASDAPDQEDPFAHLTPARTADALMITPATADILAKSARGLADDLLSTQILAYPGPVYFCPAMNPATWNNPATQENVALLESRGHIIITPEQGRVACGDEGSGRLAPIEQQYYGILRALSPQDLAGQTILVTAGPTHEYFDLVRYMGNPSSGRMGLAAALACWLRGAAVHFVHGPMQPFPRLPDFDPVAVTSASEMLEACLSIWDDCHKGIFTAAVSDFAPVPCQEGKFKKEGRKTLDMPMQATPDILATLSSRRHKSQMIAGFAAEARDLEANARQKLKAKNLDIIVANQVGVEDTPFGSSHSRLLVMDRKGRQEYWPTLSKAETAWRIADWFALI